MREIKFRAWAIQKGIMFTPLSIDWEKQDWNESWKEEDVRVWRLPFPDENPNWSSDGNMIVGKDVQLMQYTGLKDKNGKEIYDGDILKQNYHKIAGSYDDYETFDGHHIGEVVIIASKGVCMKNPSCYSEETDETTISNQYKTVAGYRCEIIGNIYENADLLKV